MPRNGSGVYSKPAGTTAVANTVIESSKYNQTIDDLVDDNNAARPIVAGGTGATSAGSARTNLGVDPARTFVTKSAGYTALAADKAANIRFDGAYTLSLTAAATLGSGWYCYVQADGGAVTIDPNASETINGATTLTLNDGLSTLIWCDGSNFRALEDAATIKALADSITSKQDNSGELFRGLINGLALTRNGTDGTNDIDIATGSAGSDGTTPVLMTLASALTKRIDASWSVGTNNGGLDTGSVSNTTYHIWLIRRSDTGVVDALFSTSSTAPTMPTNYDQKRRIGYLVRASAANGMPINVNKPEIEYVGSAPLYGCRAWVNFNGTGTVAIRNSGNVSSITDNGVGDYTVNFINAMPDGNYAFLGTAGNNNNAGADPITVRAGALASKLTTSVAFSVNANVSGTNSLFDSPDVNIAIFR